MQLHAFDYNWEKNGVLLQKTMKFWTMAEDNLTMAQDNLTMARVIWRWRKTFERWRGSIVKQAMEIPDSV